MCKYVKNCPSCNNEMGYSELRYLKNSISKKIKCFDCRTTRVCGDCGKIIKYLSMVACYTAEKNNTLCKSCGVKKSCNTPERLLDMSDRVKGDKNPMFGKTGELNPFFGKQHTGKSKKLMSDSQIGHTYHTPESKQKISDWQQDNAPMRGKSVYSVWVEKYGGDVADIKMNLMKEKQSVNASGANNPMYGKPSPNGSGNGYSGWYDTRYFRSLRELMFLIYAKRYNLRLENLEKKQHGLKYTDYEGNIRNYFSDFLVNDKYFVEIKPKRLWTTPTNILKFEKAREYCMDNQLVFKLIDPPINSKLIKKLYDNGDIKFIPRYEEKFNAYYTI